MATTNKDLDQPALNSTNWDVPLNANFGVLDAALGGNTTKSVTGVGTTPVVLTTAEYQKLILTFTGTLTANVNYQIPSGVGGQWIVRNGTSGAFTVTISSGGAGTTFVAPQGVARTVYSDGTNIRASDDIVGSVPADSVVYSSGGVLTGSSGLTYDGTALDIMATTAATNTATEVLRLDSQSSGTPAVGIGTTVSFAAETAAGNTETGMQISAITTDVSSGSEDFDFVLRLMAAGAAPAIAFRVRSTGTVLLGGILDAAGGNTATINGVTPALSSQAQAEAGTENTTQMTPLRVAQAIDAQVTSTAVGTLVAGISAGSIGSFLFGTFASTATLTYGTTIAGSSLKAGSVTSGATDSEPGNRSGTWRFLGYQAGGVQRYTLFMRIS
jgi:hypothetical protein